MYLKKDYLKLPKAIAEAPLPTATPREKASCLALVSFIKQLSDQLAHFHPKDIKKRAGWLALSANFYSGVLQTNGSWSKNIQLLVDKGYLEINKHYIIGSKCREYRIAPKYQAMPWLDYLEKDVSPGVSAKKRKDSFGSPYARLVRAFLSRKSLPKEVVHALESKDVESNPLRLESTSRIKEIKATRTDKNIKKYTMKRKKERRKVILTRDDFAKMEMDAIERVNAHEPSKISSVNGRIYHGITNLPKEYRPYLEYGPEKKSFCNVDIVACQPLLLASFYGTSEAEIKEKQTFIDFMLNNDYYSAIGREAGIHDRQEAKIASMSVMFGSRYSQAKPFGMAFANKFPVLANILAKIRARKWDAYKSISVAMQRMESDIMVQGVLVEFYKIYTDRPAICLHDSYLVLKKDVEFMKSLIKKHFAAKMGFEPNLKVEDYEETKKQYLQIRKQNEQMDAAPQ
jgi:hypothetical protein